MKKVMLLVALLAGFLSSCGDDEVVLDPAKTGYDYYPLTVGEFREYDVTEISYVNNVKQEPITYQTREVVNGLYNDQTGKEWYRVELSKRSNSSDVWVVQGVKSISLSSSDLKVMQNNRITVNMIFPVKEGKTWNPNGFNQNYNPNNSENQESYKYEKIGLPFEISGKIYDNTLTILKADTDNLYVLNKEFEVLSYKEGVVYRSSLNYTYCTGASGTNCEIAEGFIQFGTERTEVLLNHGVID